MPRKRQRTEVPTSAMAITKTKRTKRVLDPVDNTQIDYDKLADAIIRKQNRPGPQLIQDNPTGRSVYLEVSLVSVGDKASLNSVAPLASIAGIPWGQLCRLE
uniref:Uncharacterized protein n=1 Tax=Magallana gigas TaxID=29159 RepID=A0A8W8NYG0_MAGGI